MSDHHRAEQDVLREFGAIVVRRRREKGMTAGELAAKMGVSKSCVSRLENGSREIRLEILRKLNEVLKIGPDVLRYIEHGYFSQES